MDDLSDKTVCVFDDGQFQETAIRLSRDFGRTLFYKPWEEFAPIYRELIVGDGFAEIERVRDFFDIIDDVDLFVFPGLYRAGLQEHLEKLGKRVWGSRRAGRYEYMRELFKTTLKDIGLPVSPYEVVIGMSALQEYLADHEDQYVKVSVTRGDMETWEHKNIVLSQAKLDHLSHYYGPHRENIRFVVEERIETEGEIGYDGITVDGQFTDGFVDFEVKNQCCVAAFTKYEDMDEDVRMVNEKFAEKLREDRCRSMFGTEIRVGKDGNPYFLDATVRQPSPPGELMLEMFSNLSEVMWRGSVGEFVQVEPEAKYGVEIMLYANWDQLAWQPLIIPEKVRRWVKICTACKSDGVYYSIPCEGHENPPYLEEEIGMVLGIGDTVQEAYDAAVEHSKQIEGFNFKVSQESVAEALKSIHDTGVDFGDEPVPDPAMVLEEE